MCALLVFIVAPEYLILVQLLNISNSKQELQNNQRLVEGEVAMSVGSISKLDVIKHRILPLPSRLVLNLNNCYLVFALSIDMIGLCLSQYGYSFKENNGYSIYLNNTFNGLAPKMNGSLKSRS